MTPASSFRSDFSCISFSLRPNSVEVDRQSFWSKGSRSCGAGVAMPVRDVVDDLSCSESCSRLWSRSHVEGVWNVVAFQSPRSEVMPLPSKEAL